MTKKQVITKAKREIYDIESFQENGGMFGRGISYSFSLRKSFVLPEVPELSKYPDMEEAPLLNFRFILPDATVRNFDFAVYGIGKEGYWRRIEAELSCLLDEDMSERGKNANGEYEFTL